MQYSSDPGGQWWTGWIKHREARWISLLTRWNGFWTGLMLCATGYATTGKETRQWKLVSSWLCFSLRLRELCLVLTASSMALTFSGSYTNAAPLPVNLPAVRGVDLVLLRDMICTQESQPLKHPWLAYNRHNNGRAPDIGMCQINLDTAMHMGFLSDGWRRDAWRDGTVLLTRTGSMAVALEILAKAETRLNKRGWKVNEYNLAFLYKCGLNSRPRKEGACHSDALIVAALYKERMKLTAEES